MYPKDTVIPGTKAKNLNQIMERTAEHEKTMTPDHIRKLIGEHLVRGEVLEPKNTIAASTKEITDIKGENQ